MAVRGNCVVTLGSIVSACGGFWADKADGAATNAAADASKMAKGFMIIPSGFERSECATALVTSRRSGKLRFDQGELSPRERMRPRGERLQAPATSSRLTFTPGPMVELSERFMTNLPLAPVGLARTIASMNAVKFSLRSPSEKLA